MNAALLQRERLIGGRYILEDLLARGGMGEVWRARHTALQSAVAIKFLLGAQTSGEAALGRFLTEARITASLHTRHAVQVFDFGVTEDGLPFLVMELIEGETLEARLAREGRLSPEATADLLRQAARALDRAHALGIVHRDFKPGNVMMTRGDEGDEVKVVDFGIAKILGDGGGPSSRRRRDAREQEAAPGPASTAIGTPVYMAPEQIDDADHVGPAADLWAFGVVAYECLTGRVPFAGETTIDLLRRLSTGGGDAPPASARAAIPRAFDAWFRTACAPSPADRFADAGAAADALAEALGLQPIARPSSAVRAALTPPPPRPWLSQVIVAPAARAPLPGEEPAADDLDPSTRSLPRIVAARLPRSLAALSLLAALAIVAVALLRPAPSPSPAPSARPPPTVELCAPPPPVVPLPEPSAIAPAPVPAPTALPSAAAAPRPRRARPISSSIF